MRTGTVFSALALAAAVVWMVLPVGCASAHVQEAGGAPVPIAVVRFENFRPGAGVGQQDIREFMDDLTSALARNGYQPTVREQGSPVPTTGLALTGGVTELPSDLAQKGSVRFYCSIYKDGKEVKKGLYSQIVYSEDQSKGILASQNRAIKLALLSLMYDIEDAWKGRPPRDHGE